MMKHNFKEQVKEQLVDWKGLTSYDEFDEDAWEEEMLELQDPWEVAFSRGEKMAREEPFLREEEWDDEY